MVPTCKTTSFAGTTSLPTTFRTPLERGEQKANNIGYDVGYHGMSGFGLDQERAALGSVAGTIGRGLASAGRAIPSGGSRSRNRGGGL